MTIELEIKTTGTVTGMYTLGYLESIVFATFENLASLAFVDQRYVVIIIGYI